MVALRCLAVLLIWMCAAIAHAQDESAEPHVRYRCDTAHDSIVLEYGLMPSKALDAVDKTGVFRPWSFLSFDTKAETQKAEGEFRKTCRLSDGIYRVSLKAHPGNYYYQHECGAHISATVKIIGVVHDWGPYPFESKDCRPDAVVTTKIVVHAGAAEPTVIKVGYDEFYK